MAEQKFEQHSLSKSLILHLLPGIPIFIGLFLFSAPVFAEFLGIDVDLKVILGLNLAIFFTLVPVQLGILFYEGKKLNGRYTLKGVLGNLEKSTLKDYLIFVPILLIFSIVMFTLIAPVVNPEIVKALFSWYPEEYNLQNVMNLDDLQVFAAYSGVLFLMVLYIIGNGIIGPFVEELYFRGYLLPRMDAYANKWAPALNVVLFSLYHFFSPWENPIRIIALLPLGYLVWWKKDMRFSMLVHILLNTAGGLMILMAILTA
ncbi:MAG: CPBP family intramembrane glutamic endopeptidase [Candidatus Hodarchaeales archaeon]|jgi:membrane protease YdiL (CAAX protease family)